MLLLRSFIYMVGLYMPANPSRHWPCQQYLCNLWIRMRTVLLNNTSRMARWEFCMSITHVKGPGHVSVPTVGVPAPCAHDTIQTSTYWLGRATSLQHNIQLSGHCAGEYRYQNMLYCNKLRSQAAGIKDMLSQHILQLKYFCLLETARPTAVWAQIWAPVWHKPKNNS